MTNETADQLLRKMSLALLTDLRDPDHDTKTLVERTRQTVELAAGELDGAAMVAEIEAGLSQKEAEGAK